MHNADFADGAPSFARRLPHVRNRILLKWFGQKRATQSERLATIPVGQEPEVPDLYEASGQDVHEVVAFDLA